MLIYFFIILFGGIWETWFHMDSSPCVLATCWNWNSTWCPLFLTYVDGEHFYFEHLHSVSDFGFITPNRCNSELMESKSMFQWKQWSLWLHCLHLIESIHEMTSFLDIWFWNSGHLHDGFGPNINLIKFESRFLTSPSIAIWTDSHRVRHYHFVQWWYRYNAKKLSHLTFILVLNAQ